MTHLSELFITARQSRAWTQAEVAAAAGYRNAAKGLRRIQAIESGSDSFPRKETLSRFATALGISDEQVLLALSEDFADMDKPLPPQVTIRWFCGFYGQMRLPADCTPEEAIKLATEFSSAKRLSTCVRLSVLGCVYIEPDGTSKFMYGPPVSSFSLSSEASSAWLMRISRRLAQTHIERGGNAKQE